MFNENWSKNLLFSFLAIALIHALVASFTKYYYSQAASGRLTHSQLRIKQGNPTFEHRLNVFVHTLLFSFVNFKVYVATVVLWLFITFFTSNL